MSDDTIPGDLTDQLVKALALMYEDHTNVLIHTRRQGAESVLEAIRSLPVEQRAELCGFDPMLGRLSAYPDHVRWLWVARPTEEATDAE
jgi:hypothetical protein